MSVTDKVGISGCALTSTICSVFAVAHVAKLNVLGAGVCAGTAAWAAADAIKFWNNDRNAEPKLDPQPVTVEAEAA